MDLGVRPLGPDEVLAAQNGLRLGGGQVRAWAEGVGPAPRVFRAEEISQGQSC